MSNQDFGASCQAPSNIEMEKTNIERIVKDFFESKNFDQTKIYQTIADYLGPENIDEPMLNFAIKKSVEKVKKLYEEEKTNQVAVDSAIKLIVDWSLIKIKAKNNSVESQKKIDDVQIGSNKPKGPSISSLL
jgi:hypothetical protein